jgi:hypothetical protein
MYDADRAKVPQKVHRARQGSELGKELAEDLHLSHSDLGVDVCDGAPA